MAQILGFWVTIVQSKWCHYVRVESVWQPPQPASPIHIRHIQIIWALWLVVHWHMLAALHSHPSDLAQIVGLWVSYVESKWCHYVMVEADSHPKLLPTSILNIKHIQNIWAPWLVVHGHLLAALHSYLTWLWFWGSGSGSLLWSQNDVIM
jgi:hypothetical protein